MRHSLHAHIIYLENSIQDVKDRMTQPSLTAEEVEDFQLQLALAESALEHYRQAYALELSFAGSEPPSNPAEDDSNDSAGTQGKSKTNKKGSLTLKRRASAYPDFFALSAETRVRLGRRETERLISRKSGPVVIQITGQLIGLQRQWGNASPSSQAHPLSFRVSRSV